MLCLLTRVLLGPKDTVKAPWSGLETEELEGPVLTRALIPKPARVKGLCSGELERGECRMTAGDWQPGVFRTRERCSSRIAWGSSSEEPGRRVKGWGESWGALPTISVSSLSSSWLKQQGKHSHQLRKEK